MDHVASVPSATSGRMAPEAVGLAVVLHLAAAVALWWLAAHAPTIVPVIVGSRPAYTALLYGPLGLLHVSLALRVAGDLLGSFAARNLSGALTVLAVLAYGVALASASLRQRR